MVLLGILDLSAALDKVEHPVLFFEQQFWDKEYIVALVLVVHVPIQLIPACFI